MTAPDSDIDGPLHPLFPIDIDDTPGTYESEFWELGHLRPDRPCIDRLVMRARADPRWRRRFMTPAPEPRFVPALAHDDTSVDGLPRDWYRDSFPREGMPQPDGTDTFIVGYSQAEAEEREAAERYPLRRARRAIGRLVRGT